jgi:maltose O-acetyltransferase
MSLAGKILGRSLRWQERTRAGWHRARVNAQVWVNGGSLSLSGRCALSVPLSVNGAGLVTVGSGVILGNPKGPRLGDGAILLQARSQDSVVQIGDRTAISNNVTVIANKRVEIGADCIIGDQVVIYDSDFHEIRRVDRDGRQGEVAAVKICDGVWLGSRVMVLKGVEIGTNAVVACGAVVTQDLPANVVAGGVPAKIIRELTDPARSSVLNNVSQGTDYTESPYEATTQPRGI